MPVSSCGNFWNNAVHGFALRQTETRLVSNQTASRATGHAPADSRALAPSACLTQLARKASAAGFSHPRFAAAKKRAGSW